MTVSCLPVTGESADALLAILHDAEEDDDRIRAAQSDPACRSYAAKDGEQVVGAAVVRWSRESSEILYVAVAADKRGKGYGKQIVAAIQRELPSHGHRLVVGTANSALDNIAFYQKCGFRMTEVKRDYFRYIQPPLREGGIEMRDMIVFAYDDVPAALFCDVALAERIELIETELIALASAAAQRRLGDGTGFVIPVAGGVASFAEPGSPLNKVAGLGFAGVPDLAELDAVERAFAAVGAVVQVELSNLADPAIGALLTGRGYRLVHHENVLGRSLRVAPASGASDVVIRAIDDDGLEGWLDVVADASVHPDTEGVPAHEEFPRDIIVNAERDFSATGVRRYLALRGGVPAGGGGIRLAGGVAQMAGAATLPAHRRHGVQTALLAVRLADAAAAGCDIAVVTTQPGSKSQQNVQRNGFQLLYSRGLLVKDAVTR